MVNGVKGLTIWQNGDRNRSLSPVLKPGSVTDINPLPLNPNHNGRNYGN